MDSGLVFVRGIPAPQGSKRHVGRGIMVESSERVKPWKELVSLTLAEHLDSKPLIEPLSLTLLFVLPRPKLHYRKQRNGGMELKEGAPTYHHNRPDLDKLVRAVLDACSGILFVDDSQVCSLHAMKLYDERPGVEIRWSVLK